MTDVLRTPRRTRRLVLIGVAVLACGATAGWWLFRPATPPTPPSVPDPADPDLRTALQEARGGVLAEPRSATAWGGYGMLLEAHLYEAEADRCFAEAARLDPADPRWLYYRGMCAQKFEPGAAAGFFRQAAAAADAKPEYRAYIRLRLAEELLERDEADEAARVFAGEWARSPGDPRAAYGLGLVALRRGDQDAAVQFLTAARESPTARRPATAHLAVLARARGDTAAAAAFEKAAAPKPTDVTVWPDPLIDQIVDRQVGRHSRLQRAEQLERDGSFAAAAEAYLAEAADRPTAGAYTGAGLNLARVGEYDRAVELIRKAVGLDPRSVHAHYSLALVQFTRAEKLSAQSPGDARARDWFREAVAEAERATGLKPDHARAYLFWGLSLKHLGDPAGAVGPLRKGVACWPDEPDLQLALGEALLDSGKDEEARGHLEAARRLAPNDPRPAAALDRLRGKKDG